MKIGIVSDVHCNQHGLLRALDIMADCDELICLGDSVYERGTAAEFRDCYSWAPVRGRTRAALGNHEYLTASAAPARAYFKLPSRGYYRYVLGSWLVVVLNSYCGPAGGCALGGGPRPRLAAGSDDGPCSRPT